MKQDHYNHAHLSTYLKQFRFMLNMVITSKMQNISQSSVVIHCPCFILVSAKLYGKIAGNTLKMSLIVLTRCMPQINSQFVQISKFSILLTSLYVLASKLSGINY